jgi:hypothetical protein
VSVVDEGAVLGHQPAIGNDLVDAEVIEVSHDQEVGDAPRGDRAGTVVDPVGLGAVDGRHLDGDHRIEPLADRHPDQVVQVAPLQHVGSGHVIGAETDPARRSGDVPSDHPEVLREEVGERGLADPEEHAVSQLLQGLGGIVAFVVEADAGRQAARQVETSGHRRATKHRQAVPPGELDGAQHRLILFLHELADGLPNPDALRPLLGHAMIIRPEVIPTVEVGSCRASCRTLPRTP